MIKEDKISHNYLQTYCLYKLGSIEGNKKFEKLCFELKDSLEKEGHNCSQNFDFKRDDFGPRDPGISKANLKFEMMGIEEIERELNKKPINYKLTEKGAMWVEGLTRFYNKTITSFSKIKELMDSSLNENKNLSGSQLVKKESVQTAKEELFGKKV